MNAAALPQPRAHQAMRPFGWGWWPAGERWKAKSPQGLPLTSPASGDNPPLPTSADGRAGFGGILTGALTCTQHRPVLNASAAGSASLVASTWPSHAALALARRIASAPRPTNTMLPSCPPRSFPAASGGIIIGLAPPGEYDNGDQYIICRISGYRSAPPTMRRAYSITSSAMDNRSGDTVRPSARAVCRLMANTNLVD